MATITAGTRSRRCLMAIVLTVVMMFSALASTLSVSAAGGIDWGTAVKITKNGQVVDSITVNGKTVKSYYAPRKNIKKYDSDSTYCCAAFVKRFYKTVYGVDVWNLYPGNCPNVSSGYFYKVATPKTGDIAANSGHWAIVRSAKNGAVKIIEQNCWNSKYTCAQVGRTLYNGSGYWYWRWSGADTPGDPGFSFTLSNVKVSTDNATIKAVVTNPKRILVKKVGCYIYDANGKQLKKYTENCSRNEGTFNVWYDIKAELGMKLKSKTTYKYKIFVIYNGKEYCTKVGSFKTK